MVISGPDRVQTDAASLAALPGFGPGVHLMTTEGELPVEWLATGDRLITRDHGAQPILWIGRARVRGDALAATPGLMPVEIAAGALGEGCPSHTTRLSRHARVLLAGAALELHTGVSEALAEIGALVDGAAICVPPAAEGSQFTYLLLPVHAVVQANGIWSESLLLDGAARAALAGFVPDEVLADPALAPGHARAARLYLTGWEVTALRGARGPDEAHGLIRRVA